MSTRDVFNCLFPLNVQNEIQLLSRVFCYSWLLVCLLNFWLRNAPLVKVGNPISDGIGFVLVGQICADLGPNCSLSVKNTKFSGNIEKNMGINM